MDFSIHQKAWKQPPTKSKRWLYSVFHRLPSHLPEENKIAIDILTPVEISSITHYQFEQNLYFLKKPLVINSNLYIGFIVSDSKEVTGPSVESLVRL